MTKLLVDRLFGASFTIHSARLCSSFYGWKFVNSRDIFAPLHIHNPVDSTSDFFFHCCFRFILSFLYLMSFFIHLLCGSPVLTSIQLTHFPQSCRIKRLSIEMKFNPFTELKRNEFIFCCCSLFQDFQRKFFFLLRICNSQTSGKTLIFNHKAIICAHQAMLLQFDMNIKKQPNSKKRHTEYGEKTKKKLNKKILQVGRLQSNK